MTPRNLLGRVLGLFTFVVISLNPLPAQETCAARDGSSGSHKETANLLKLRKPQ